MENVRIRNEANLITIHNLAIALGVRHTLHIENGSTTWTNVVSGGRARICFIDGDNFIVHVENQETIGLLIHQHDVVFVPENSIFAKGVRHSRKSFGKFLLSQVDKKLSFVFFVEVLLLIETIHVKVFGPVADSGSITVSRSA